MTKKPYPKMNPKWKDWWLRALRGGNFVQGTGHLRCEDNTCCCLGVLVDGINPSGWHRHDTLWCNGEGHSMPDRKVYAESGLSSDAAGRLAAMNDREVSFVQIADWIEEHL